jgi:hypothetical protein
LLDCCAQQKPAKRKMTAISKSSSAFMTNGFNKLNDFSSTTWYPTYATLKGFGMKKVADLLQKGNKPA